MSFLEHLEELRRRLFSILLALSVGCLAGWFVREPLLDWLTRPVQAHLPAGVKPVFTTLTEPFVLSLKVAFFAGLVLTFPWVVLQIWLFVAPGLYPREKHYALPFLFFGTLFFFLGCGFGYVVVFPAAAAFLVGFAGERFTPMLTVSRVFGFELQLIVAMGVVFETPVLIFLLSRLGLVTPTFLWRNFKYAVLGISVLAAVLTPTPDAFTMLLVAAPMVGLYLLGVAVAFLFGRPRPEASVAEVRSEGRP